MRIKRISVINIGPLRKAEWNIDCYHKVALICGPHGSGKTTFLDAIDIGLSRLFTLPGHHTPFRVYVEESTRVSLTIVPTCDPDREILGKKRVFRFPSYQTLARKCYETMGRRVPFATIRPTSFKTFLGHLDAMTRFRIHDPWDEHVDILWADTSPGLNPVQLLGTAIHELRNEQRADVILSDINKTLAKVVDLELALDGSDLVCRRIGSNSIQRLDYLSDAEYYTIGSLLFGLVLLPRSGIMVMDSPETYLNPRAQYELLSAIVPRLDRGQIIIATHSPSLISSFPSNEIYVLTSAGQDPMRAETDDSVRVIRELYGKSVCQSVLKAISDTQSDSLLTYLLQCSLAPGVAHRKEGDPQIQQLAMWLSGHMGSLRVSSAKSIKLVDVGAGKGDLLHSIVESGCTRKIIYFPVEPQKKHWQHIKRRSRETSVISHLNLVKDISEIHEADLVFFVNVLHELSLTDRITLLLQALRLTLNKGVVIVHEVAVLPKGESSFVMWNGKDLKQIFETAQADVDIAVAKTTTRPGGWPLETICMRIQKEPPSYKVIRDAAVTCLPNILERWTIELAESSNLGVQEDLRPILKAFRMAQVANLCVWIRTYQEAK